MTHPLTVYLDHTCPYSYMAFSAVRRLADEGAVEPAWRVLPIAGGGPDVTPDERRMHAARRAAEWPEIRALAETRFGLALERPEWGADARTAAAAWHWVRRRQPAAAADFHKALFEARFGHGLDIGDPAVLEQVVHNFGLDPTGLADALRAGALDETLGDDAAAAEADDVTAVPTLILGGTPMVGAQPADVLRRALAALVPAAEGR